MEKENICIAMSDVQHRKEGNNFYFDNSYEYKCTCGYNKTKETKMLCACPKCKSRLGMATSPFFGEREGRKRKLYIDYLDSNKNMFKFYVKISGIDLTYDTDFINRTIGKFDVKREEYTIVFDGTKRKEDMLKVINSENKITSLKEVMEYANTSETVNYYIRPKSYIDNPNNIYHTKDVKNLKAYLDEKYYERLVNFCLESCNEILIKANINPNDSIIVNKNGTNPSEILGVSKFAVKHSSMDFSPKEIKYAEERLGKHFVYYFNNFIINDETFLKEHIVNAIVHLITEANMNIVALKKYIFDELVYTQYLFNVSNKIKMIEDSFNMTKLLKLKFEKYPKDLVYYHDTLLQEINLTKDQITAQGFSLVYEKYNYLEDNELSKDFSIALPKSSEEVIQEGKNMSNCVASYIKKVVTNQCVILFLREKKNLDKSFVTVEYRPLSNKIVQVKAKFNNEPNKEVKNYIKKYIRVKLEREPEEV